MKMIERRAVSNMVAVLILIGVVVVAGVVIYSLFTNTAGVASTNSILYITNAQIVAMPALPQGQGSATGQIAFSVKNAGSVGIVNITITINGWIVLPDYPLNGGTYGWTPFFNSISPLAAGESASFVSVTAAPSAIFAPGAQDTIILTAIATSGGSFTTSETVTVSG